MFTTTALTTMLLTLISSSTSLTIPCTSTSTTCLSLPSTTPDCPSSTTFTPPAGKPRFQLLALPIDSNGNTSLAGTWVRTQHDASISTSALLTPTRSFAPIWHFDHKTGAIFFAPATSAVNHTTVHYRNSLRLYDTAAVNGLARSDVPAGDFAVGTYIGVAADDSGAKFSFDPVTNVVQPPCGTFSACWLNSTAPFEMPGAQLV